MQKIKKIDAEKVKKSKKEVFCINSGDNMGQSIKKAEKGICRDTRPGVSLYTSFIIYPAISIF
jgi:hypothetical protein